MFQSDTNRLCSGRSRTLFAAVVFFLGHTYTASAFPQQIAKTELQLEEGSIPPHDSNLRCISDLDAKPYSAELIDKCLHSIARARYILDARVETTNRNDGTHLVDFIVRAKTLITKDLTFAAEGIGPLQDWIARNHNNLQKGGIYTPEAEASTYQAIKQFYLAQGIMVGIVPTVRLNYGSGVALVHFQVVDGPRVPRKPAYFPYGPACEDEVTYIDWSEVDEHVPLPLMESLLKLSALGSCFEPELMRQDQDTLKNFPLFETASVELSGTKGDRHLSVKVKAKPLIVGQITIHTFGSPVCSRGQESRLPLKLGEIYTSLKARDSADYLSTSCGGSTRWTEVAETDEVMENGQLQVIFEVLGFPLQAVFVDGEKIE
jgi:hypothetical protein